MNIITVHCTAKPGKRNDLILLGKSMIGPSRAESGCIFYSFFQDMKEEDRFFFYEEWKDQQAIDSHNRTRHFLEFQPKFKDLIVGEAKVTNTPIM
jgi:quinol monooxygenase YgiN